MRKFLLVLAVLVVLSWAGWQMLPGPRFGSIGPQRPSPTGPPPARSTSPEAPRPETRRLPAPQDQKVVRRDLEADEARGGHTIARHVGLSDAQLRERLARESISAASTYADLETAERVVGLTLQEHASRVERWEARRGPRPNLVLPYAAPDQPSIGRVLRRGAPDAVDAHAAVVVLRWRTDGSFVLTSYPEDRPREAANTNRRAPGRQEP